MHARGANQNFIASRKNEKEKQRIKNEKQLLIDMLIELADRNPYTISKQIGTPNLLDWDASTPHAYNYTIFSTQDY